MLSSSSYALLRIVLWSYLPDLLTKQILLFISSPALSSIPFISSIPFLRHPVPPLGSPPYVKRYRYVLASLISLFLIYNLVEALRVVPPNFYQLLSLSPSAAADDNNLKQAFRSFAKKYHPDHLRGSLSEKEQGEQLFREVRGGYEALRDPMLRFAYDRFGPDALTWSHCSSPREFIRQGLIQSSGYHVVSGAGLVLFGMIGKENTNGVAFWRYLLFFSLLMLEVSLILSPSPIGIDAPNTTAGAATPTSLSLLSSLFPNRVTYQHILFLHQLFVFLSIAISRVAPVLVPLLFERPGEFAVVAGTEGWAVGSMATGIVDRMSVIVNAVDKELFTILQTTLMTLQPHPRSGSLSIAKPTVLLASNQPLQKPSEQTIHKIKEEMQNIIIENRLQREPPLKSAWENAMIKGLARERQELARENELDGVEAIRANRHAGEQFPPSPTSPTYVPASQLRQRTPPPTSSFADLAMDSPGRLPSPRPSPSPPPGILRRGSSLARARSVSC